MELKKNRKKGRKEKRKEKEALAIGKFKHWNNYLKKISFFFNKVNTSENSKK